ncbi:MAG: ABC transporter permease subunit [Spirochaetales bacterium]|nr:ABC transporter permease subunit [Spirochaetales bacterium]
MANSSFLILLTKEFRELARSKKLLIGLAVFLFFSLASPLTARYMNEIIGLVGNQQGITFNLPEPVYTDSLAQLVKNLSQIGLFVMIFLVMGLVVQEKERGTAAFLMVKPVSRAAFILAKFVTLTLFSALLMLVSTAVCGLYTGILFGVYPWKELFGIALTLFLYMTVILSVTLLMSTVSRSQAAAGIFSLGVWLLLSLLSQWGRVGRFFTGALVGESSAIMFGMSVDWRPYAGAVGLTAAALVSAVAVFRRWEA